MPIFVNDKKRADLKRADFFVSLIPFMPMSKNYIPKMGPEKAVRLPTLP